MGVDDLQQIQILNKLFSEKELELSQKIASLMGSLESQKAEFNAGRVELERLKKEEAQFVAERIQIENIRAILLKKEQDFSKKEYALQSLINQIQRDHHKNSQEYLMERVVREGAFTAELRKVLEKKHNVELKNNDLTHLLNAAQQLESQLRTELATHQQMLIDVVTELENLKKSFTYRLTAPLRGIYEIFIPPKSTKGIKKILPSSFENIASQPSSLHPIQEIFMPSITPIVAAASLDELLAHHDADFIHCAYLTLIGRVPDPEGMRYYLTRIRAGRSKIAIIHQLTLSVEAKNHNASVVGLKQALKQYKWEKMPILGVFIRSLSSEDTIFQKINQIENSIYVLEKKMNSRFDALEESLQQPSCTVSKDFKKDHLDISHLTPSARKVYVQLKNMSENN